MQETDKRILVRNFLDPYSAAIGASIMEAIGIKVVSVVYDPRGNRPYLVYARFRKGDDLDEMDKYLVEKREHLENALTRAYETTTFDR